MAGGTGQKLTYATTVVAGVASLSAALFSIVSIWLQTKNYRKPLLQRYVVRILLMVPIYSVSSWVSLVSFSAAQWLDPIRDVYEAFTIYTFFQLLINYLGGERNLIITTHGRAPVAHLWPLDHVLSPVDISDPYTFLAIKRGILQYAWLKPVLGISAIIMKATGTYKEGYIDISSGYLWSGIIYNISVTLSLYSLGLFWVCMHDDLKPFRPMPKFLCIKLIIFASYWQGFALSILVWLGAIPDNVEGYTQDNLAAAIQDALICIEMPIFAVSHWYAFSWHDYADNRLSAARLPVWYAVRDAFGPRDLIEDTKETFSGDKYKYRQFDSNDKILAHEASKSRLARLKAGMRYERGGRGKYWLPNPNEINEHTSLLQGGESSRERSQSRTNGTVDFEEPGLDPGEEDLYKKAKKMEFGDWNYPVITANKPSRDLWTTPQPSFARIPHIEPRSSSSSPSTSRPSQGSRPPSADLIKSKTTKGKKKGKRKESIPTGGIIHDPDHHQHRDRVTQEPLPHESETAPSGFGTANEDYTTVTEEYLEAAERIGYDGKVKNVENEGPLAEGSRAWEEAREEEEASPAGTPSFAPIDGADDEVNRNPWDKAQDEFFS
ncbi:hypothetical protein KVR01_002623 [Diaporthe batatas]|uniref:uncharacterized protein n=1 Tax=Diaporthe batatas TaxID=748121 RepID=UPI001D04B8E5|nr:uncharacterized protein KVR01_002623 [Diaporthe batatas]KAG8166934.1 hypothetical protein KVR01_002623 [Diaporthe batatas]